MDRADALDAVIETPERLQELGYADDKAFVLDVLEREKGTELLRHASERLRDDVEVVLAQMRSNAYGEHLVDASARLQRDRALLLEAATTDPFFLEAVSQRHRSYDEAERSALLADRELVLAAARGGNELRWADPALHADREIAMTAAEWSPRAFLHMAPHLREDPCVRLCGVQHLDADLVDALLTTLEAAVKEYQDLLTRNTFEYEYAHALPFEADTVHRYVPQVDGPAMRERVAIYLNTHGYDAARELIFYARQEGGAFDVEAALSRPEPRTPARLASRARFVLHGMHDSLDTCLRRLEEVDAALPHVAAAIERKRTRRETIRISLKKHPVKRRKTWATRVEALATALHAPCGGYAELAHKRSYAEAFA
jgi:hypothetical protein